MQGALTLLGAPDPDEPSSTALTGALRVNRAVIECYSGEPFAYLQMT